MDLVQEMHRGSVKASRLRSPRVLAMQSSGSVTLSESGTLTLVARPGSLLYIESFLSDPRYRVVASK